MSTRPGRRTRRSAGARSLVVGIALVAVLVVAAVTALPLLRGSSPARVSSLAESEAGAARYSLDATAVVAALTPPADALPPVGRRLVKHGPRGEGRTIALTFDLCATPQDAYGFDEAIVRELERTRTPATFFMGGLWARKHPVEARRLAANPRFEIANHSMRHGHFLKMSDAEIRGDLLETQRAIQEVTGRTARAVRFPFDEYDGRLLGIAASCGLVAVAEDVRTGDPDGGISAKRIVEYVTATAKPGSIVIMHANGNGVHTAAAMPGLIKGLRRMGLRPVTLSQLLHL